MAVGDRRWTFLLQPTGKVDVLARVERTADDTFVFDVDAGYGDALVARLNRFKIRVKVDVEACRGASCVPGGTDVVDPDPGAGRDARIVDELEASGCRRLAGDGARDRAGGDHPRRDRRRRGRGRLPQGLLPRPGARRADGLAGRRRARALRVLDVAPTPGRATRSSSTAPRSACSPASPAPARSARSSAASRSAPPA